jgi:hypothetical protein
MRKFHTLKSCIFFLDCWRVLEVLPGDLAFLDKKVKKIVQITRSGFSKND